MDIEKVLDEVMHVIRKNVDYFNEASLELKIEEALKELETAKPVNVALADVSGSFEEGYEKGWKEATSEACKEIAKNYQPNER